MNRLVLAAAALTLVGVAGCSHQQGPAPTAAPTTHATPRSAAMAATPTGMTAAPTASGAPADASLAPAEVTAITVSEHGDRIDVSGVLLGAEKRPIVGAVGDFFIDGSTTNLVQSYATREDGSFSASFTTRELPAEATLMMHYRGDSATAAGTFVVRRGTPRPAASAAPAAPASTAAAAPTPTRPAAARPVAFTDTDGNGRPHVTVSGPQARVEGRLITAQDGRPVRGATVTWRVGNGATGQGQTANDGAFALTVELPEGAHEIELAFAGTPERAATAVTLTA